MCNLTDVICQVIQVLLWCMAVGWSDLVETSDVILTASIAVDISVWGREDMQICIYLNQPTKPVILLECVSVIYFSLILK